MATAITNVKSRQLNTTVAATDFIEVNDALFIIGADERILYSNDRLFKLIHTTEAKLLGKSYHQLFHYLSRLYDNDRKILSKLLTALNSLKDSWHRTVVLGKPFGACAHVGFFRLYSQEDQFIWGGVIREGVPVPYGTSRQVETFQALTSEIRSSLVSIIGCASILQNDLDGWNGDKPQEFVNSIVDNAQRSVQLVENLRDSWGIGRNSLQLDFEPTDLQRLIRHVLRQFSDQLDLIEFAVDISQTLPTVEVDSIRMGRVMHTLFHSILNTVCGNLIRISAHQIEDQKLQLDIYYQGLNIFPHAGPDAMNNPPQHSIQQSSLTRELYLEMYVVQSILNAHNGTICTQALANQNIDVQLVLPLKQPSHTPNVFEQRSAAQEQTPTQMQLAEHRVKVLVAEDDPYIMHLLKNHLEHAGHSVTSTNENKRILHLVRANTPEIILLNWRLADPDGPDLCAKLRKVTSVPIMVIAHDFSADELIQSLAAGADDYVSWPIQVKEVLARIQAHLRRTHLPTNGDRAPDHAALKFGELVIDFAYHHVTLRGNPVRLTPIEYKLLHTLASNAGRILTHGQLISKVWGPMFDQEYQYLWVNISRLRTKLEDDSGDPKYILTERGIGYSFAQPDETA